MKIIIIYLARWYGGSADSFIQFPVVNAVFYGVIGFGRGSLSLTIIMLYILWAKHMHFYKAECTIFLKMVLLIVENLLAINFNKRDEENLKLTGFETQLHL